MEAPVDPRAEWRQMFRDVTASSATSSTTRTCTASTGRRCGERYSKLLDDAVTRWDVDFLIGEFIGELNASHTYHGGGDMEQAPQRSVGLLGVDWELAERRLPDQADHPRRPVGRVGPLTAGRARRDGEGRGVRAGRERRSDRHEVRSVGLVPGAWATRPSC